MEPASVFDIVGAEFFSQLVEAFYLNVENNEVLRPMYPADLTESKRHLELFLIQYWGGPRTYQDERGHPRLRMRHAPFEIGKRARDAWLKCMTGALESVSGDIPSEVTQEMRAYFEMAASSLRNV
jgi:hemoglobin